MTGDAVRESPSLADYQAVRDLAGEGWPEVRMGLLDYLRQQTFALPEGQVEIFLDEGLIDEAIAAAETWGGHRLLEQVVDAAIEHLPEWVIRVCRQQAEPIMDQGRSQHYHHAVRWLEKARAAYRAAGREGEWQEYLEDLLRRHWRKYKLVSMLEGIAALRRR